MATKDNSKSKVMHYLPEMELPIFIQYDPSTLSSEVEELLVGMGFFTVDDARENHESWLATQIEKDFRTKILNLKLASPMVARQIKVMGESDQYGVESASFKGHYQVYRYYKMAMIIHSPAAANWEAGVLSEFCQQGNLEIGRMVINRFLSWALMPYGFVGFWGEFTDKGILITNARNAKGEALFLNIDERELLMPTGPSIMGAKFHIYRHDPIARNHNRPIPPEELLSFLHYHHTFLDYQGVTPLLRQMLHTISQQIPGRKRDLKMGSKSVPLEDAGV